jgi:CubicO group peptidase (beta-lactamase class C family)
MRLAGGGLIVSADVPPEAPCVVGTRSGIWLPLVEFRALGWDNRSGGSAGSPAAAAGSDHRVWSESRGGGAMTTPWVARHGMTSAEYQAAFDSYAAGGYRLLEVSGYSVGSEDLYAAIWDHALGPARVARHGMSGDQYQSEFDSLVGQGYRLVDVSGYAVADQPRYAAIWEKSAGPAWVARHGLTAAQYQAEFDSLVNRGYRLVCVSGYTVAGQPLFAGIWEQSAGPAWVARHNLTAPQYQAEFDGLVKQGYRLVDVSGYAVGGQDLYAAIWEQTGGPRWVARHGLSSSDYQGVFDQLVDQGYRLSWVSGYGVAGRPRYAAIWQSEAMADADIDLVDGKIAAYMQQQSIPGLSIAIAKQERLVFAKGYGYADTSTKTAVTPDSVFRIASISKPITAVAVMKLVDARKLTLDDKVFGHGAILGTQYGTKPYSKEVRSIKVRHLLSHTSGWSNTVNGVGEDPMFMNLNMSQAQLIGWVLDTRPLAHPPGKAYEYLNFGFCVLGRVIEKLSREKYETYVQSAVLAKCGIHRMRIGSDTQAGKAPDEVTYYGSSPYSLLLHRMDAHGGWIATPIDLLRLMVRVDGFTTKADILTPHDEAAFLTSPKPGNGYGLGWIVDPGFRAHNGAMDGTIGFLVRRDDGFSFAALANHRPPDTLDSFAWTLKSVLDDIVSSPIAWPSYDLF